MFWQITPAAAILLAAALIVALTDWLVWRRHDTLAGIELFWLLSAIFVWCFSSAMEAAAPSLPVKVLWSKIEYLGSNSTPPLLLIFSLTYTRHRPWLTCWRTVLLWTLPVITVLLAATNEWHHLIWTGFVPESLAGANLYVYLHGPAYWLYVSYIYIYAAAAAVLVLQQVLRTSQVFRKQSGLILCSMIFPWVGSVMYVLDLNPLPGLDTTPISFAFTALVIAWAIFSTHLLDLVPVARDLLIENLIDGVLVIDQHDRIVDANPAAIQLLGVPGIRIGAAVSEDLRNWPALVSALTRKTSEAVEITMDGTPSRQLEVHVTPITDSRAETAGYLATLRDITPRKQIESALREKSLELERLAVTDSLTGLYNRRAVDEVLEREFRQAEMERTPLSLALFDIDDFKRVNDQYGHHQGDEVLKSLAECLRKNIRLADLAARTGGDEFLIIFPGTDLNMARIGMERFVSCWNSIENEQQKIHNTLSCGVTTWFPGDTPEEALKRVDLLLYQAKQQGKNRIICGT